MSITYWIKPAEQATANLTEVCKAELKSKGFIQVSFWRWAISSAASKGIEYQIRSYQTDHPNPPTDGTELECGTDPQRGGVVELDAGRL
jgi:hypothetical protein